MSSHLHSKSGPATLGDFSDRKQIFQLHYEDALRELQGKFAARPGLAPAWAALEGFMHTGGKRLRPLVFLSAYELLEETRAELTPVIYRVACGLELFHAFAVAHDDIIDGSHTRRHQPTLHRRLAADAGDRSGENLALVLGDILFGFTIENFLLPGLDPVRANAALRYFSTVAQDTGLGEALELTLMRRPIEEVTEEDIFNTYYLKTTRYTFEAPLVMAAILAGAAEPVLLSLHDYARPLGLAFQIENDLHEINSPDTAADLRMGVKTLFLKRCHEALSPETAATLRKTLAQGDTDEVRAILGRGAIAAKVSAELKTETALRFQEARQVLLAAPLRPEQREGLLALTAFVHRNSRHSEALANAATG
jgi:geranylgeranyl diphosphate synthase type I